MSETKNTAYPDILGCVTGGERLNIGVVQMALAIRPQVLQAGRPFEVLILLQNASNAPVDVTLTLQLPERDAKKQKDRFIAKVNRLVIGLQPAEVGYALLPVTTLADTASADDYRIGLEVAAKANEKPHRIRPGEGAPPVDERTLRRDLQKELAELKTLSYSTEKRGLMRGIVEVSFSLLPGKVGSLVDLKPGWHSLWTLLDLQAEDSSLAHRFGPEMRLQILPRLSKERVYKPLVTKVEQVFNDAGYPLQALEASFVARLLGLVLIYAATGQEAVTNVNLPPAKHLQIGEYFEDERYLKPDEEIHLPQWANGLMRAVGQDKRAAQHPLQAITHFAFDDLLMDGIRHGLQLIEEAVHIELGDEDEHAHYAHQLIDRLHEKNQMDFVSAYMPLVIAGTLVYEHMLLPEEDRHDILDAITPMLKAREKTLRPEDHDVYAITRDVARIVLMKYGIQLD
jgi:hypothetical protein